QHQPGDGGGRRPSRLFSWGQRAGRRRSFDRGGGDPTPSRRSEAQAQHGETLMTQGTIPTLRTGRAHPHPEPISRGSFSTIQLMPGDRNVVILDQRLLPGVERYEFFSRLEQVAHAISTLMVRGAPAIGIAAAYGLVLGAVAAQGDKSEFLADMQAADG